MRPDELLGRQDFDLRTHLVADAGHLAPAAAAAAEPVGEPPAALGEVGVGGGSQLGEGGRAVGPFEDVAGRGEADGEAHPVLLHPAGGDGGEQLRVERPVVQPEDQIRHPRADEHRTHRAPSPGTLAGDYTPVGSAE